MDRALSVGAVIGEVSDLLLFIVLSAAINDTWGLVVAIVFAVGILTAFYKKVIVPGSKGITIFNEEIVPNVKFMKDLPKLNRVLTVVEEIAGQFRKDSGSTLKDTTDRLEEGRLENRAAAEEAQKAATTAQRAAEEARQAAVETARANRESIAALEVLVGTIKEHAKDDRDLARGDRDLARDALQQMISLTESAARTEASGARQEASGARIEAADVVVAEDLAATQKRADDVHADEPPGTASDAASQSPEDDDEVR